MTPNFRERRLRRSRTLVLYWDDGELVCQNYLVGTQVSIGSGMLAFLSQLDEPTSWRDAQRALDRVHAAAALDILIEQRILLALGSSEARKEEKLVSTWRWGVDAQFFHYATRDVTYTFDHAKVRKQLLTKARTDPPPSPFKTYRSARTPLPTTQLQGDLGETLFRRRTCRSFSQAPLSLNKLSTILLATFGKTQVFNDGLLGKHFTRTSPSGGARHPIEAYVVATRITGVRCGIYHYSVEHHSLVRVATAPTKDDLVHAFSGQTWVADAACAVFMTAVLPRSMWKYDHSRAMKVVLLDAGHLGQTLHLAATASDVAVFTSAALQDASIERMLRIDGIEEIVLYGGVLGSRN